MSSPHPDEAQRAAARLAFVGGEALTPLLGDAGMRRYFRCKSGMLMDCPPALGGIGDFVHYSQIFAALPVPRLYKIDEAAGLLLLEDFGDRWLYEELRGEQPEAAMAEALRLLGHWQTTTAALWRDWFSPYDRDALAEETALWRQWFLPYVGLALDAADRAGVLAEEEALHEIMAAHQTVCVHRDYHCRNLMRCPDGRIGILDYQDTLWGAPSYDLISITRDCYRRYAPEQVQRWEADFGARYYPQLSPDAWARLCESSALQRHLKVLGIFVRLWQRDGKRRYLDDLPLVLSYAREEAERLALPHISRLLAAAELPRA